MTQNNSNKFPKQSIKKVLELNEIPKCYWIMNGKYASYKGYYYQRLNEQWILQGLS